MASKLIFVVISQIMIECIAKASEHVIVRFMLKKSFQIAKSFITRDGNLLVQYTAIWNAFYHN